MYNVRCERGRLLTALYLGAVVFCTMLGVASGDDHRADSNDLLADLVARWEAQRHEVVSGRLTLLLLPSATDFRELTFEQARSLFSGANLAADPVAEFGKLVPKLFKGNYAPDGKWFYQTTFVFDGPKTHQADHQRALMFDGKHDVVQDLRNTQADVFAGGASRRVRRTLASFRYVPDLTTDDMKVVAIEGDDVLLSTSDGQSLRIEWETAMLKELTRRDSQGAAFYHRIQRDFAQFSAGIWLPMTSVELHFRNGYLSDLQIGMIQEAEFNTELPRDAFAVAAGSGSVLVDHRGADKSVRRLSEDVTDVAALAEGTRATAGTHRWRLVFGVAVLVFGAFLVWRYGTWARPRLVSSE